MDIFLKTGFVRNALFLALFANFLSAVQSQTPTPEPAKSATSVSDQTRLLRFPTTNGTQIVFAYAGNLYTVGVEGGIARRLTSAPGYCSFPHFSPDGAQLAYTAQYDGNTEVYEMPADGGVPKRLTITATLGRDDVSDRMGPNNIVLGWKNTEPKIVFRSRMKSIDDFVGQLFTVGADASLPAQLPVPRGGFLSFSPDDTKMAYNRVFREFRTWKRYRGGMADDVWVFDFKTGAIENITNDPSQDIIPMWGSDNRIYFLSDRDGHLNLFSYDLGTKETVQRTFFKDYDVKFPSIGKNGIVFEQAGYIWFYDLASAKARQVPISIREDFASGRDALVDASEHVESVSAAPDAKRLIVVARGDLFSVPAKDGTPRDLTNTPGAHERDATWSPDGKWIAYNSDETGENELYIRPQDGKTPPKQVTSNADTYYYQPRWSPDSQKLLWSDRLQRLRFVDVGSKAVVTVEQNKISEISNYAWSPDSKWIAYDREEPQSMRKVLLYSIDSKIISEVTDGWYESESPVFSDDGKYLLFASSRDFNPIFGQMDFDNVYRDLQRVYLVMLSKDTLSPLKPRSDEVGAKEDDDKDKDKKTEETKKKAVAVKVDLEGIKDRIAALKIDSGDIGDIRMVDDKIFYLRETVADAKDEESEKEEEKASGLFVYDLKKLKETELATVGDYEITQDGKKMLVKIGKDYGVVDLPSEKIELKDENKVKISGLDFHLSRHAEWTQIYDECWRQMRDFFYAPNMNGVDWPAIKAKYSALLPYVNHRNDLTYLIGEMIGELNNGHTYVGGGERPITPRIQLGLLGAEFSRDPATKAYRIDRILPGENWDDAARSPLTEVGLNIKTGDYILAVNGEPVSKFANLYEPLIGTAGKQVILRVNSTPSDAGARDVTVVPIADESPLYYKAWVRHNIDYVSAKTGGQVGYLHIPNMGKEGLNEFMKLYDPQIRRRAIIIDERDNGGGFVSPLIAERLARQLVMVEMSRNGTPKTNPPNTFLGPMVLLMNEFSASDGDIFPYRFRALGLGKLIGKRTWGGVVGIRNPLPLVDGGQFFKPEFAPYAKDGKDWVIESHGVDPDIVVDNDPSREFKGEDQQLDRAIQEIVEEMKTKGYELPPIPPYPDRSKTK